MRNLKLAFRTLARTPFVTAVAILSLALGIGANAAIYSLFDQLLLRPLPVRDPGALVNISSHGPKHGSVTCNQAGSCEYVFSYPMLRDLEREQTVLEGIAGHRLFGANLAFRNQTLNGEAMYVSGSYFPLLGVRAARGRLLGPADDETVGAHFVAVLSHAYWESQLGADPGVIGETIIVNGNHMTIVGIAPPEFSGTTLGARPHVFVPLTMRGQLSPGFRGFENRRSYWVYAFGRLKPGVSQEQARTALNAVYRPIINDVEAPLQEGLSDQGMAQFRAKEITLEPGARGQSSIEGNARTPLILLFATTGIVLLIACANIANLLLARGASRAQEMAVRLSLGASRRRVLAQLLTESLLLAAMGGAASLLVAQWTLSGIGALMPPEAASTIALELDGAVVLWAAGLSVFTGLLFGMFPALHATRPDLITALRAASGQPSGARAAARFRTVLVTAQIALSMALLTSAGLFIRSLMNVSAVDLGLHVDNVVTFRISPQLNGYEPQRSRALFERVEEELAAIPGVTNVSASVVPLLSGSNWGSSVRIEGIEHSPDADNNSQYNTVGPGYFATLGIPLLAGREFSDGDDLAAPKVVVVNEAFVRKFNMGTDIVGRRMSTGGQELDLQIVGLVKDAKYSEVKQEAQPQFFVPYRQEERIGQIGFYVRSSLPPAAMLRAVQGVIARLDPNLPVEQLKTMPQQVRENIFLERMIGTLASAFALLATILAAVGLYGVLAYTVAQRTREIGVRMALGANAARVRGMVLRQVARMVVVGAVIGIGGAVALGRGARSILFEVQGHDPASLGISALLLALVAFGAGYLPAVRASRVEPMQALRYE